jgi:hypothetical protein
MQRRLPWLLLGAACARLAIDFWLLSIFGHVLFRLPWRIQLFFLCIYNTPEDERERSPMRFYFGTSNAQPVILLFVSLLCADASTAAAGWEKRAMMDFDGYVSLQ